jgi:predicted patatin/cPLA2 family phospholipase
MVKTNIIRVSPGGLKGFYILGILNYLRNHYRMDHYIYSGASAGAWNSLIMCSKRDNKFVNQFIDSLFVPVSRSKSIEEIQYLFKHKLLDSFDSSDFDFSRLHIGVVTLKDRQVKTQIYTNFTDLTDAIDCCMSSSHIPLITGKFVKNYRNHLVFDGGFSSDPYIKSSNCVLHIEPNMWTDKKDQKFIVNEFIDNISMNRNNPEQLYQAGYLDAEKNVHDFAHLKKIKI